MLSGLSLTQKRWVLNGHDERLATTFMQRFAVPDSVARIMAGRGIPLDEAADFLDPTLRNLLPDPFHLKDMDKAVKRVLLAIKNNEKICVYGDYDVDGATSSALLVRYMRMVGVTLGHYIPDRLSEGYGPNAAAMQKLAAAGYHLIITVDCGITSFAPLQAAKDAGLDVIVLDHHVAEAELPNAVAIINPNRLDETSPHGHLAAVGVTFLFLVALNGTLREAGFFEEGKAPDLLGELDIVALGTICDMVALKGVNRALVRQGLKVMGQSRNIGLCALRDTARHSGVADTYLAGFLLGPRVNAGGRVGQSDLGTRLLSTQNATEAQNLARDLDKLNDERRLIEQEAIDDALQDVSLGDSACIFAASDNWHVGVIGLVASRLKERYNAPAFVTSFDGDIGKGSCRSVKGIDIGTLVIAARQQGLLANGGGHAMAAGYTVARSAYDDFQNFIDARISQQIEKTPLEPQLAIDGLLSVGGVTVELAEALDYLAPFGMGNPEPRFAVMDAALVRAEPVGQNHLRLHLKDDAGNFLKAMAWRAMDNAMGQELLTFPKGTRLHIAGHIRLNSWAMRTDAQLIVDDIARA